MNSSKTINTFAIILASGSGSRFKSDDCPKHLIKIKDVPTVVWTLNSIVNSGIFKEIVVVTKNLELSNTNNIISQYFDVDKLGLLSTSGGAERMESFLNGVSKISENTKINNQDLIVLIDANRPFCSAKQMIDLNDLAAKHGCSCPARPLVNGVAKILSNRIIEVPTKENYLEFVTPEFIRFELFDKSKDKKFKSLVEYSLNMSVNPTYILSSDLNSKLTYQEDLVYFEKLVDKYNLHRPSKV